MRAIGEHMTKMRVTDVAGHLNALHAVAVIDMIGDNAGIDWFGKARPSRSALELALRIEEFGVARPARIATGRKQAAHLAGKWSLGAFEPHHVKTVLPENLTPLLIAFLDPPGRRMVALARKPDDVSPVQWLSLPLPK